MQNPTTPREPAVDRLQERVTVEQGEPVEVVRPPLVVGGTGSTRTDQVTVDYAAERYDALRRTSQLISFVFGVVITLIAIRVVLRLIAANSANGFAQFIYGITGPFVAPFVGLTGTPALTSGSALEISSLVAAVIYALLGWGVVKLVWLLFYRPATRDVTSSVYRRQD